MIKPPLLSKQQCSASVSNANILAHMSFTRNGHTLPCTFHMPRAHLLWHMP